MDIQQLAIEYNKLQSHKYFFGIENGECVELRFEDDNFYHLLGFKKFKDATIVKMIEDEAFYKNRFLKYVLSGKISFYQTETTIKNAKTYLDNDKFVNFCDVEELDQVKMVMENRFPYFTYENIRMLFNSELIILYDKEKGKPWNKIDAEKIFFKFMTKEKRNLNLFIKYSKDKKCEVPVSFFLEEIRNDYLLTRPGCKEKEQIKAAVTYIAIQNKGNAEFSMFEVYWGRVRYKHSRKVSTNYKVETKLHDYFYNGGNPIRSNVVTLGLCNAKSELEQTILALNNEERYLQIGEFITCFVASPESDEGLESAISLLDTYGIDVENGNCLHEFSDIEIEQHRSKEQNLKSNITKLNNKIKKINKFFLMLIELEREEIIYVYEKFIPSIRQYAVSFFQYLVTDCNVFEKNLFPKEIEQLYKNYLKR